MDDQLNGFTGFARKKASDSRSSGSVYVPADAEPDEDKQVKTFDPDVLAKIPPQDRRWSWVEVDLGAIRHNVSAVKHNIGGRRHLLAVMKADGYGHGAVPVAKAALGAGADYLGVATVDEGIQLREGLVNAPILVLSQPPETAIPLLLAYKIEPSIYSAQFAIRYGETADAYGTSAPYHLAVNTGMNRIGVRHDEVTEFIHQVAFHRALKLKGTFTHFATADSDETLDFQIQVKRFYEAIDAIRAIGMDPGIIHCANSAATFRYSDVWCDMVRLGIGMYGLHPCADTINRIDLKPAMSVHARITDARQVPMSDGVSYGLHYRSTGSVKICTIPVGYADGLPRAISGHTSVIYQGHLLPQVGTICMDQCMFEVDLRTRPNRPRLDPQVGEEVLLVGSQGDVEVTLDYMAQTVGTINYELACALGSRLARVYV